MVRMTASRPQTVEENHEKRVRDFLQTPDEVIREMDEAIRATRNKWNAEQGHLALAHSRVQREGRAVANRGLPLLVSILVEGRPRQDHLAGMGCSESALPLVKTC